ncbi:MAG: transposase [Gemmataceae bacterium]|nr:transposase [Gemmataceae bacterium]
MFNLPLPPSFHGLDEHLPLTVYYRHLPHWRQAGATYFVTFRMIDSLPNEQLRQLQFLRNEWKRKHPPPWSKVDWDRYAREATRLAEDWLDQGHGACYFAQEEIAKILTDALLFFQGKRYFVSCFTVMPNHCHVVIRPFSQFSLEKILQICKGYVAYKVNRAIGRSGTLWQQESFDRIVRDEEHLYRVLQYIGRNPAKAKIPRERWVRWLHPEWIQAGWCFEDDTPNRQAPQTSKMSIAPPWLVL